MKPFQERGDFGPEGHGKQLLENLFIVSWLGMTPDQIDCHVYVLRGPDGLLLIDCGAPWGHPRILRNFLHWGLDIRQVRTILLTHGHVDHGRGGYLFKRMGTEILAHVVAAELAEKEWADCLKEEGSTESYRVDGSLGEGHRIQRCGYDLAVLHTPGHTAGCLSFLTEVDGQRCLFSGDLLMSNGKPGWSGDPGFSREKIIANLKRLIEMDFTNLCHGHNYRMGDGKRWFRDGLEKAARGEW
ncbi:MAG: MBL fold metallo-hydrolase [Planctomycetes bacterium]|nr:MBL fold metallo-hydrolase [Planctomycetota bacterium]